MEDIQHAIASVAKLPPMPEDFPEEIPDYPAKPIEDF